MVAIFEALYKQVHGKGARETIGVIWFAALPLWEQAEEIEFLAEEYKVMLKGEAK